MAFSRLVTQITPTLESDGSLGASGTLGTLRSDVVRFIGNATGVRIVICELKIGLTRSKVINSFAFCEEIFTFIHGVVHYMVPECVCVPFKRRQ